jgi:hypothetical protein
MWQDDHGANTRVQNEELGHWIKMDEKISFNYGFGIVMKN